MERTPPDRRIGRRRRIDAREVRWRLPAPGGKERRVFGRRKEQVAELLDVSVSGLRLLAPEARDLSVGAVVHIAVDGHRGPVRIRTLAPTDDARTCTYGVELADPDSPLTSHVHRKLSEASDVQESAWHDRADREW